MAFGALGGRAGGGRGLYAVKVFATPNLAKLAELTSRTVTLSLHCYRYVHIVYLSVCLSVSALSLSPSLCFVLVLVPVLRQPLAQNFCSLNKEKSVARGVSHHLTSQYSLCTLSFSKRNICHFLLPICPVRPKRETQRDCESEFFPPNPPVDSKGSKNGLNLTHLDSF